MSEIFPKKVTIALDLRRKDTNVMADANQINQALLNLCVNARGRQWPTAEICC